MSFTATFTVQQNTSGAVVVTDTSDYSVENKSSFSNRQIFFYKHDGTLLNSSTDFTFSNYPLGIITLQLTRDYSLFVTMSLTPISPVTNSSYTVSSLKSFDYYANEFVVSMACNVANNFALKSNPNYYASMQKVYVNLKAAIIASNSFEQKESQFALNEIKNLIDNQILFF